MFAAHAIHVILLVSAFSFYLAVSVVVSSRLVPLKGEGTNVRSPL